MLHEFHGVDLTVVTGAVIAAILSWKSNRDKLWCVVHALLGWGYVFYWVFAKWSDHKD